MIGLGRHMTCCLSISDEDERMVRCKSSPAVARNHRPKVGARLEFDLKRCLRRACRKSPRPLAPERPSTIDRPGPACYFLIVSAPHRPGSHAESDIYVLKIKSFNHRHFNLAAILEGRRPLGERTYWVNEMEVLRSGFGAWVREGKGGWPNIFIAGMPRR